MINYIVIAVALLLSAISAFYSVTGLVAIFPAAVLPIILMGGALEIAKIVSTVWLHINWSKDVVGKFVRNYIATAVAILILITSMGVFGFLSKSHMQQQAVQQTTIVEASRYDSQIDTLNNRIHIIENDNKQIDAAIDNQIQNNKASAALHNRAALHSEEIANQKQLDAYYTQLDDLKQKKITADQATEKAVLDVGPIKYIAELLFSNSSEDMLEKAVRVVILMIIFVFDPLALLLLIAGTSALRKDSEKQEIVPQEITETGKPAKKQKKPATFELDFDITSQNETSKPEPTAPLKTTSDRVIVTDQKPVTVTDKEFRRKLNVGAI